MVAPASRPTRSAAAAALSSIVSMRFMRAGKKVNAGRTSHDRRGSHHGVDAGACERNAHIGGRIFESIEQRPLAGGGIDGDHLAALVVGEAEHLAERIG